VNLGGEPERDDFGLPPVDIEIPDDARELDRDVQAYRRELRAQRRRQRRMRLRGPLTRDGVVLPLLASCLVLALIAGTLLTVFTAGPGGELPNPARSAAGGRGNAAGTPSAGSADGPADSPTAVPNGMQLPEGTVRVGGAQASLQSLRRSVLALVPAACHCAALMQRLQQQAHAAGVRYYLVGGGLLESARQLQAQGPQQTIVTDSASILVKTYMPVLDSRPVALLVKPDGSVSEVSPLQAGFRLNGQLHALATAPAAGPASPPARASAPASTSAPPG
jgi:hypothetical protein